MADEGLIIDVDYNITKAEAKQRKLNRELELSRQKASNISKTIKELNSELDKEKMLQADIKDKYDGQLKEAAQLERHIENLNKGTASVDETMKFGGLNTAKQKLTDLESTIKKTEQELEKSYNKQQGITKEINKQSFSLSQQNAKTAEIGDKIALNSKKQNKFTTAFAKSQKSADRFGKRLKSLIASALFFSVVTKAFTALRNEFGKLITETGTKTAELTAKLNGSLAVLGRTLYESARPYIEWIIEKLIKMVNILTYGLAKILGKNVNEMKKLAKQTEKTGKEAEKSTASFDTLQKADSQSASGSDSGVGKDFGALNGKIENEIALLMSIISGAVLVLGVILTFTGANIPLGLGLIAVGAVGLAASLSAVWDKLPQKTKNQVAIIMAIVSGALLVLGVILAFSGAAIPLGIALIVLGAAGLVTSYKLAWDKLPTKIKNQIGVIMAIISGYLLVIGVILAFSGANISLGIGLIIAGAAGLVTAYKLTWNTLPDKTKNIITAIMAIGGALFLLLGLILILSGAGISLGIGCILLGVTAIGGAVALTPGDSFLEKVKNLWNNVKKIVKDFIKWFSEKVLDGIFGKGFGDTLDDMWDTFTGLWEDIISFFKNVFSGKWKEAGKSLLNVLIGVVNLFISKINLGIQGLLGGGAKLINGIGKLFGADWELDASGIKIPLIPKLATGAVIPGGSPFLAMLGDQRRGQTNIEAPADLIRQIVREETGGKKFEVKATGSMAQLIRLLRLEIKEEDDRATVF